MAKNKEKEKIKKFSLTEEEKSDYYFYFRLIKEWSLMVSFWQSKLNWTRMGAIRRLSIDPEKYNTNWKDTLEDGTFTATLKKNEPKLQEEQKSGKFSKKTA